MFNCQMICITIKSITCEDMGGGLYQLLKIINLRIRVVGVSRDIYLGILISKYTKPSGRRWRSPVNPCNISERRRGDFVIILSHVGDVFSILRVDIELLATPRGIYRRIVVIVGGDTTVADDSARYLLGGKHAKVGQW